MLARTLEEILEILRHGRGEGVGSVEEGEIQHVGMEELARRGGRILVLPSRVECIADDGVADG